jgi:signal transduction histidine kinase
MSPAVRDATVTMTMERARRVWRHVRALDPRRRDAALATVAVVAVGAEMLARDGVSFDTVLGLLVGGLLVFRARHPLLVLLGQLAAIVVSEVAGAATLTDATTPIFCVVPAALALGARYGGRRLAAAVAVYGGAMQLAFALDPDQGYSLADLLGTSVFFVALPVSIGRALENRRLLTRELALKAARLEQEREEEAVAAVAEERARIAGELHDVVAHAVSVMIVQAGAARRIVRTDRDRAREALGSIETTGREALDEMRRVLGVLRRGDEDIALVPQPGLERVGELVARARERGLTVTLEVTGEPAHLAAGPDLAAYRVLEEGLANAGRHAGPAQVRVEVRYAEGDVELVVRDDGQGPRRRQAGAGAGHGLVSLRERLSLYGGTLDAGRRRGGGFVLRARLPHEGRPGDAPGEAAAATAAGAA